MKTLWNILRRIPPALYAALVAGLGILFLILRGRRLEAELATAKLREQQARAAAHASQALGKRAVYEIKAAEAAAEVRELELEAAQVQATNLSERKRIENLSDAQLDKEYAELAKRAKERARQ